MRGQAISEAESGARIRESMNKGVFAKNFFDGYSRTMRFDDENRQFHRIELIRLPMNAGESMMVAMTPEKLRFTDDQRAIHHLLGEVTLDVYGNEVLGDLSPDETKEVLALDAKSPGETSEAERARYKVLIERSWVARKRALKD